MTSLWFIPINAHITAKEGNGSQCEGF